MPKKHVIVMIATACLSLSCAAYGADKKTSKIDPGKAPSQNKANIAKWNDVEFLISQDDLEKIYPNVVRVQEAAPGGPKTSISTLKEFSAAGINSSVNFHFGGVSKKLELISLHPKDVSNGTQGICNTLDAALSEKYGTSIHKHSDGKYTVTKVTQWTTDLVTIQLSCSYGDYQSVQVTYAPKAQKSVGL